MSPPQRQVPLTIVAVRHSLAVLAALCSIGAMTAMAPRAAAQGDPPRDPAVEKAFMRAEAERHRTMAAAMATAPEADLNYDVTWYRLDLRITPNPQQVRGTVTIRSRSVINGLSSLRLDLSDSLAIDSITDGLDTLSFTRTSNVVTVHLDDVKPEGDIFDIRVSYHGLPPVTGFGSFKFGMADGAPWISSLSQPYGAKDWWPCKDQLIDKADSSDVIITTSDTLRVGSNGTLAGVTNNGDGTATTHWKERYPIDTYLISIAISNYAVFSNWFVYSPTDSMEVLNYVLPRNLGAAQANLPRTVTMLGIYSDMFGLYPFIAEKYGHCDFSFGGAMEHQTMTSTGAYYEDIIAHELAHQWFGDMITCASWADLWLNEGFATYCAGLYRERAHGQLSFYSYMTAPFNDAKFAAGTLHVQDTLNVGNLFAGSRVYNKGAWVLQMLRHAIGDSSFFEAMDAYAHDSTVRFGTATTEEFRAVCERVSGGDLGWFFDEWVYGNRYPSYTYGWKSSADAGGYRVDLRVTQTTGTTTPAAFRMPVDVHVAGTGWDTTFVVTDSLALQDFVLVTPVQPTSVRWDPDRWVLRDLDSVSYAVLDAPDGDVLPRSPVLLQNYPNPFNPSTTISYTLPSKSRVSLTIVTVLGEVVATLSSGVIEAGSHRLSWDATGLPAGVYMARLDAEALDEPASPVRFIRKMLYIR